MHKVYFNKVMFVLNLQTNFLLFKFNAKLLWCTDFFEVNWQRTRHMVTLLKFSI